MHGDVTLRGPLFWVAAGLMVLAFVLAIFGVIDALRPDRAKRFANLPEPRWLYIAVFGAWVVGVVVAQVFRIAAVAMTVSIGSPLMLAIELAYLLRVVYPKRSLGE